MSNAMKQLSRLAKLIFEIEIDLGLSDLSQPEKLVLMAAHEQSDADGQFQTHHAVASFERQDGPSYLFSGLEAA